MRVKYKYIKRKWLWLTVDARKIDLASISSVVLLSHREFLKLLLFLYEFERIKTNMNWLLIFWSYRRRITTFFLVSLLRKASFFPFMGVELSIVNNHVYNFHNNKLHHDVWSKRAQANRFSLVCLKEKGQRFPYQEVILLAGYLALRCIA